MLPTDYQQQATITLSNKFHGDKVTMAELRGRLMDGIRAGNALDEVKKALFYGKGADIGLTNSTAATLAHAAPIAMAGAEATNGEIDAMTHVLHMALGKFTEASEVLEAVLKAMERGRLDCVNVLEEVGDGLWYDANLLTVLGSNFGEVMAQNNGKLRKRFPEGFNEHDAINRDLEGERALLEGRQDIDPAAPGYDPNASRAAVGNEADGSCYCGRGGSWGHEIGCPEGETNAFGE